MTKLSELPPYKTRISPRAKHLQIKISARHGIEVVIPKRLPKSVNIEDFIYAKRDWILKHAKPQLQPQLPKQISIQYLDECWDIDYIQSQQSDMIQKPGKQLTLMSPVIDFEHCQPYLKHWLKELATEHLIPHLEHLSHVTQLSYQQVRIRQQKTRWGSCSADKVINLNAHLMFLPYHLVNHIMIHELAHTVHLNHSSQFWKLVARHDIDFEKHRALLKRCEQLVPDWVLLTTG